ncbi:hypothetical protein [Collimonas silvisoli]|uniref:hypothetical protein n=1 Tax=Collimonas silvisoli TaxID=2825884 RepID=UPI002E79ED5A|nr:hypothetical protein [Collimonas silvisoli]
MSRVQEFHDPVLSPAQCDDIVQRLLDVEAFWLPRHRDFPFYTLGATNYYDIVANPARPYRRLARQYNPFLLENFAEVYDALLTALRGHLRQTVGFYPGAALPGFHIFAAHPAFEASDRHDLTHEEWFRRRDADGFPGNPIHVDTAHLAIGLPAAPTISFTLAIAMPQGGAGMKIWPLTAEHMQRIDEGGKLQLLRRTASRCVAYRTGGLFVHSGDFFHQARGLPFHEQQYRITLQGHGAWLDGQWQLFW